MGSVSDQGIDQIEWRFPCQHASNILGNLLSCGAWIGRARIMWRDRNLRMPPVCVLTWQGFSPEHVEHSMANVAIIKGGDQIFVDHDRASAKIDKRRSLRQQSQHLPIDEVLVAPE